MGGLTVPPKSPCGPDGVPSPTLAVGMGVEPFGFFLQPITPLASTTLITAKLTKAEHFIVFVQENLFRPTGLRVAPRNSANILDLFRGHVKQRQDTRPSLPTSEHHRAGVGRPRRIFARRQYECFTALRRDQADIEVSASHRSEDDKL